MNENTQADASAFSPIEPTVGRVVLYTLADGKTIRPADIVHVQSRVLVELSVKLGTGDRSDGMTHLIVPNARYDSRPSQPGTWRWMPFQVGQAARTEQAESQLRAAQPHFRPAPDSPVAPSSSTYRQLTSHKVNGCNEKIVIDVVDDPGQGGANHLYRISGYDPATNPSWPLTTAGNSRARTEILFQNGPILDSGVNGITQEVLLAIIEDRLAGFQQGKWANADNAEALEYIRGAQAALQRRTKARVARGVEGTHAL